MADEIVQMVKRMSAEVESIMSGGEPPTADQAEPYTEWRDDYLIVVETGQIIGTRHEMESANGDPFVVNSIDAAEWVLDRMARREAALVALRARREAIVENLAAMIKIEERALVGLHRRFDAELETFARQALVGSRTKTLRTAFGSIRFRMVAAKRTIVDMAAAVAWAKVWTPGFVRLKADVLISDIERWAVEPQAVVNGRTRADLLADEPWMETRPAEERMYLETGVEAS